jgi:hypothetical protein
MPYYFQNHKATRFFIYSNVVHNGSKIDISKLYATLAPQNSGVKALNIYPYNSTERNLSIGYPNSSSFKYLTGSAGKWSIVDTESMHKMPNFYVVYNQISSYYLPPINPNTGISEPFTLVLQYNYFKNRYFLLNPLTGVRTNQPTLSGRWIYSRKNAFNAYITTVSATPYVFNYSVSSGNLIEPTVLSLDTEHSNRIILSNNKSEVLFKLNPFNSYSLTSPISSITAGLVNSFISLATGSNIRLSAFDANTKQSYYINPSSYFGRTVKLTNRNIAVAAPYLENGKIFIYTQSQYVSGNPLVNNDIVLSHFSFASGFGSSMAYKGLRNSKGKEHMEILAISSKIPANSSVAVYHNNFVTSNSGSPLFKYPNTNNLNFYNNWSLFTLTNSSTNLNGCFGFSMGIQTKDPRFNHTSNLIYVSDPFYNKGIVNVYSLENRLNVTTLSSASASNYGYDISCSGPYVAISAPYSVINNVSGCLIDIYKLRTLTKLASGLPFSIDPITNFVSGSAYLLDDYNGESVLTDISDYKLMQTVDVRIGESYKIYYKLDKTDTIFIPTSSNLGISINLAVKYYDWEYHNRRRKNFYDDYLIVSGDEFSQVYARRFDKFVKINNLPPAKISSMTDNIIYQIDSNLNTVWLNTIR